uniref:Outer membrane protein assembly factor n=1 Tax=Paracidobacterium acidisoli TaxID=2303751 RepID=A0A372ITZ2_9BACT
MLAFACVFSAGAQVQAAKGQPQAAAVPASSAQAATGNGHDSLQGWSGLTVADIRFEGVDRAILDPLPGQLAQQPGMPLDPTKVRDSLRNLFATGRYKSIVVEGTRQGNQITLIFNGTPAEFIGQVTIQGVKGDRLSNQLRYAARLSAGTAFNDTKLSQADSDLKQTLEENGFYQGTVASRATDDAANSQVNVQFQVHTGKQARVGDVQTEGDRGMDLKTFRKKGRLKEGSKVNRDTVSRALAGLRKQYQKKERLEADLAMQSKTYQQTANHLNYKFTANQGPVIRIRVNGAKLSSGKIRNLVPVYEEGSIDEDLLNEGTRRVRDYFQRRGYFRVKVDRHRTSVSGIDTITYNVTLGEEFQVDSVTIAGNHYFSSDIITPRLNVHATSLFERHGLYSQALETGDVNAIKGLYQSNGFTHVEVTPQVKETTAGSGSKKSGHLAVHYVIQEGAQQKIEAYQITGEQKIDVKELEALLSTQSGQPYSLSNIAADRDAILGYYLRHGYDHAQVTVKQDISQKDPNLIDVQLHVTEGEQLFVRRLLISGLHYTRPSTVQNRILLHPGEPLNQTELLETQRRLYDLTLFNEVTTAVQNPNGEEQEKNVLLQFREAKRWNVSYGVGFQAQTGNPQTNCNEVTLIQLGLNPNACNPNGNTGASALVELDASRINLGGRDQSINLRTVYGSLEKIATMVYSWPHVFDLQTLDFSLSGGYTNAQDLTTYAASRLEGNVRFTQRRNRANTFIYQFTYRRVKVDANTVQVAPNEIPLLSEPVRIGGPEITWVRDTRRPQPLDAHAGTYNSIQEFVAERKFASEADFNRFDWTNSSYYALGSKKDYVLARNTRFGFERSFGNGSYEAIPLPERLYAGGAESLRGFPLNSAGPRDSVTGFPIGGAGVFINQTELRFPNPVLPFFGNALGLVLFHDMGNAFNNSSDIWPSFLRTKQPHSYTCKDTSYDDQTRVSRSSSTNATGTCDFNNFSHAVGLGARYHTPIGPLRLDFSYNLNPPIYPVVLTYSTCNGELPPPGQTANCPHVGQAGHFNFFFSIGQSF